MSFDATVTWGNVLATGIALMAVFSALVFFFGQKFFPTRKELGALQRHIDKQISHVQEQIVETRTDVETAVRGMENLLTKEVKQINELAKERHDRQCGDFERLEKTILAAMVDVREARDTARDSRTESANTKEAMNKGIERIEQAVARLNDRRRASDQ